MKRMILQVYVLLFAAYTGYANEQGRPYMTFYTSVQMGGHFQNWAVIQDNRGVMYVGNGYGIEEFDGSRWRLISLPNSSFASSFAKDSTGRIFVGSAAEIGYLAPDKNGNMQYVSLLNQLSPADRNFTYVQRTLATPEGIYFQTAEKLHRLQWIPGTGSKKGIWKVKTWNPGKLGNYFMFAGYFEGTLYVQLTNLGLMKIEGDAMKPVPGGEKFTDHRFRFLVPLPGQPETCLLGTPTNGLIVYDGKTFRPFPTDADLIFKEGVSDARILKDGNIGICSLVSGFLVLNPKGKLLLHLNKSSGLMSQVVRSLCTDRQNNVWLAMDGGVGILEYESDLSFFPLQGSGIIDIINHKGTIYANSVSGIYTLDTTEMQFRLSMEAPLSQYAFFCVADGNLYVLSLNIIYMMVKTRAIPVFEDPDFKLTLTYLLQISNDKSRFLLGTMNGVVILKKDPARPGRFKVEKQVKGIFECVFKMLETSPGIYWISTYDAGALRLHFEDNDYDKPVIERFGPAQGLPLATTVVNKSTHGLVFSTNKGFMKFDEKKRYFEPDTFFKELKMGVYTSEALVADDIHGNIWANAGSETALYRLKADGTYTMEKGLFARFGQQMVNVIYTDDKGAAWFGYTDGVAYYMPSLKLKSPVAWSAMIQSVRVENFKTICPGGMQDSLAGAETFRIPFHHNSLYFEYTGLSYIKPDANEFSVMLDGFDKEWSAWSPDYKKNYTNLSPGKYTFKVKSRNVIGQESSVASFPFTIITPWYVTWWAYALYIILALLAVYLLVRFRTRKLRERSDELEEIVEQRTAQIQEQKNNIEQLSLVGRDITASLSIENIIRTVYENVNKLMDAAVFTIGLYKPEEGSIEFPASIEKNQLLQAFSIPLSDEDRLAVWCFNNRQEVIINDYHSDYSKYISRMAGPIVGENPESILYLPLWNKEKVIGVISAQSFRKNAYSDYHVNMLRNLATYSAIALENADAYNRLADLLEKLKATQSQLIQSEKMASLGELTAGIAHEIQNPLNFVNNFSEVSNELLEEMEEEIGKGHYREALELAGEIKQNLIKIDHHGKRADAIVKGMLLHSRSSSGMKEPTDINALADEYLRLSYHGLRAKDKSFNATMKTDFDETIGKIAVIQQEMGRAILNILNNAFYAVSEKKKMNIAGYEPTVWVSTKRKNGNIEISVRDNGTGIPQKIIDKIYQPFFTTKPTGEGTGLGMSLSYDIITKVHGGELKLDTVEGDHTEFIIKLPA